ncbi:hypothetical protein IDH44_11720 [Paenibacillus sp. IB182496]|uniref:Yip1 domain-containing protein n=1 Tax=Paenibacillus sabuli TaxID=2772509 RepID=A0A927BSA3_9BACL|nr:hypothetical protein [Paenibacillus sabuli]MBD2845861.1 hypothetical protein [Paenibacillus sabuli]
MAYCTACGQQLQPGEAHACPAADEVAAAAQSHPASAGTRGQAAEGARHIAAQFRRIEPGVLVRLLRQPREALSLEGPAAPVYGFVGVAAALIGFIIWAMLLGNELASLVFGFGSSSIFDAFSAYRADIYWRIIGRMLVIGLVSSAAMIGVLYAAGRWLGEAKLRFGTFFASIGAMQLVFGAGFVLAGLCSLINLRLSLFVMLVVLLAALVLLVSAASDLLRVPKAREAAFAVTVIGGYLLVTGLLLALFL